MITPKKFKKYLIDDYYDEEDAEAITNKCKSDTGTDIDIILAKSHFENDNYSEEEIDAVIEYLTE